MTDLTEQQTAMLSEGICPHCQTELHKVVGVLEWRCSSEPPHQFEYYQSGETTAGWCRCQSCGHTWFGEYGTEHRRVICPVCVGDAHPMEAS